MKILLNSLIISSMLICFSFAKSDPQRPPSENEVCYTEYLVASKTDSEKYKKMLLYSVCINGYSYTATGFKTLYDWTGVSRFSAEGITQDFEIHNVDLGIYVPRVCSCDKDK